MLLLEFLEAFQSGQVVHSSKARGIAFRDEVVFGLESKENCRDW